MTKRIYSLYLVAIFVTLLNTSIISLRHLNSINTLKRLRIRSHIVHYPTSRYSPNDFYSSLRESSLRFDIRMSQVDYSQELKGATGHPHSIESKRKISAANKGKVPWNLGKHHSEETKQKISQRTKEAMQLAKMRKANDLGLSADDFEKQSTQTKRKTKNAFGKSGLTDEGRQRISESMKIRWQNPEFRKNHTVGTRTHSESTRAKISASVKAKWQDEEYRLKMPKLVPDDVKERISATLKARWQDPDFRHHMSRSFSSRNPDWNANIATKIKEKWKDKSYRNLVSMGVKDAYAESVELIKNLNISFIHESRLPKSSIITLVKKAIKSSFMRKFSIQSVIGGEIWEEEKLRHTTNSSNSVSNSELEDILWKEWGTKVSRKRQKPKDEFQDFDENDCVMEDIIETYNEFGELTGTYTVSEYEQLRFRR